MMSLRIGNEWMPERRVCFKSSILLGGSNKQKNKWKGHWNRSCLEHVIWFEDERDAKAILIWYHVLHVFLRTKRKDTFCSAGWHWGKGEKKKKIPPCGQYNKVNRHHQNKAIELRMVRREKIAKRMHVDSARSKGHSIKWFSAKSRKPSVCVMVFSDSIRCLKHPYEYLMSIPLRRIVCVSITTRRTRSTILSQMTVCIIKGGICVFDFISIIEDIIIFIERFCSVYR